MLRFRIWCRAYVVHAQAWVFKPLNKPRLGALYGLSCLPLANPMSVRSFLAALSILAPLAIQAGQVYVDADAFGESLGGWKAHKGKAAEYRISGAMYCTFQPEVTPSPDGGIFISLRIDHMRGFLASDDYASLELSFAADGTLVSAQSSLALQGRTISSELIRGGASATTSVAAPGIDRAVKVGSDLVADLSAKLLREKIVEPGRVSFPAVVRHNYNLLYQAVKTAPPPPAKSEVAAAGPATVGSQTGQTSPTSPTPPDSTAPKAATPPNSAPLPPLERTHPPAPPPPPVTPPAAAPVPPAGNAPAATTTTPDGKKIPLPDIKLYNGGVTAPQTPLPGKKKNVIVEYGDDVLKIARDVAKEQIKK